MFGFLKIWTRLASPFVICTACGKPMQGIIDPRIRIACSDCGGAAFPIFKGEWLSEKRLQKQFYRRTPVMITKIEDGSANG